MPRSQRIIFLTIAAVLSAVAVVIFATRDDDGDTDKVPTTTAVVTATTPATTTVTNEVSPATTETTAPTPEPARVILEAGKDQRIEVTKGDQVEFVVRSETADEVHVHGYDIKQDITAGGTATFSFKADITGIFEIELEDAGAELGKLVVNPD